MSLTTLPPELDPRRPAPLPVRAGGVRRAAAWVAGLTAAAVLGTSAVAWGALTFYDAKIDRVDVGLGDGPAPGAPVNILLVGSDSRASLSMTERNRLNTGGEPTGRTDVMILAHISADNSRVTLVSFPRDSYVTIPAHTSTAGTQVGEAKNKLNASFAYGGPALTIKTIEANTGLSIDHYVEIDIAGFVRVVDALGGAEVCVKQDVYDKDSGLDLSAGKHQLDGEEALAYVRARKIYADSDLGRIRAQQAFIGSLAKKALSADTLTDPIKLNRFLGASLNAVTTDKGFGKGEILSLAERLRDTQAGQIRFVTVPLSDLDYRVDGVGSSVLWDDEKADAIFTAIANDEPIVKPKAAGASGASGPTVAPGAIDVEVLNGTTTNGLARKAAESMAAVGFGIAAEPTNADAQTYTRTTVQYDPTQAAALATVKASLPGAEFVAVDGLGKTFVIIAGSDWTAAKKVSLVASSSPSPSTTQGTSSKDGISTTTAAKSICT